ncbi:adenosine deaminase-like protein [Punica granatum]|uniref:Adenosine deaminase-like protein n=1 Tax=Punica granatum TaxID=22663 RepID=A0A6P8DSU1_PUNGR|nr:adenosine deaminase-like protein [Punica granatum]
MESWVSVPKVELHAHLNGSIRDSTLLELARTLGEKGTIVFSEVEHVIRKNDRSLKEVFKLFDLIHILTTDHSTLTRITKEVVEDFASENVIYLELRTTPKKNDSIEMTKRSYMDAVIKGLRAITAVDVDFGCHDMESKGSTNLQPINDVNNLSPRKKIYVRLLLSIDRRESTASAMETVKLALEMQELGVVGIDLSGNPVIGEWVTFLPALVFAREQGFRITLHCGEVLNPKEVHAMLDFHPERMGHVCFFNEEHWKRLKTYKIPVEICLTSNIMTETISSVDVHHFADLYKEKHPLVLCTDDSGVFSTSLSKEYSLAASSFGIGKEEMLRLAKSAVEFIFSGEEVKRELREIFDSTMKELRL